MTKNDLPVIFVFDMDKTLIGDTDLILQYDQLMEFIRDGCKHKRLIGSECKLNTNTWVSDNIPATFFRPNLQESLVEIKKIFPTAEFFVFSLGTKAYVYDIIPYLEKQTGIKFNRPLFTRTDASSSSDNKYLKDIHGYYDTMFKALSHKYPKCKDEKYQNKIMKERTVIIDDTAVWGSDERWVPCKEYTYKSIIELDKKLLEIIYKNPEINTFIRTSKYINTIPAVDPQTKTFDDFLQDYHLLMFNLYNNHSEDNKAALQDDFFVSFVKAIKKRNKYAKPFDAKFLKTLKDKFV